MRCFGHFTALIITSHQFYIRGTWNTQGSLVGFMQPAYDTLYSSANFKEILVSLFIEFKVPLELIVIIIVLQHQLLFVWAVLSYEKFEDSLTKSGSNLITTIFFNFIISTSLTNYNCETLVEVLRHEIAQMRFLLRKLINNLT